MAEDKLLKNKKTKEIKEDIYALDLNFEDDTKVKKLDFEPEIIKESKIATEIEEQEDDEKEIIKVALQEIKKRLKIKASK